MTLLVRNEADLVDAQIAFHLRAGVDFVVATDNRSNDGTSEILERYARAGHLHLLREDADDMRQSEWVTRMARMAATEFGADWVLNTDADEFWWPRGGSLKDVLAAVPERYGVIRGCWRHFVPRPGGDPFFAERMTVRLRTPAHPGDKATVYHAHQKAAHRAHPEVVVAPGNHDAEAEGLQPLRTWYPIEVLHFSIRSPEQAARKAAGGWVRNPELEKEEHQLRLDAAVGSGRVEEHFRSLAVSDAEVEAGVARGDLAHDTRLREALRSIRHDDGSFPLPSGESPLRFHPPSVEDAAEYAAEVSVLVEVDGIHRAAARVEALERRLQAV